SWSAMARSCGSSRVREIRQLTASGLDRPDVRARRAAWHKDRLDPAEPVLQRPAVEPRGCCSAIGRLPLSWPRCRWDGMTAPAVFDRRSMPPRLSRPSIGVIASPFGPVHKIADVGGNVAPLRQLK